MDAPVATGGNGRGVVGEAASMVATSGIFSAKQKVRGPQKVKTRSCWHHWQRRGKPSASFAADAPPLPGFAVRVSDGNTARTAQVVGVPGEPGGDFTITARNGALTAQISHVTFGDVWC